MKIAEVLAERNYNTAKAYYKYRLGRDIHRFQGPPVVIYQMGKVGSETVQRSLQKLQLDMPIYHVHYLSKEKVAETESERKKYFQTDKYNLLKRPWLYQFLRKKIETGLNGKKWKIITLTREPVARNLSAFFENVEFRLLQIKNSYEISSDYYNIPPIIISLDDMDKLESLFFEKLKHDTPLVFFDREIKEVFGFDIFNSEFSKEKGYNIYESYNADILLIRLENLNECASEAFEKFLNITNFSLIDTNTGTGKIYAPVYQKFKDSISLPEHYIDKLYNSKYMQHFYSKNEIEQFRRKWRREN